MMLRGKTTRLMVAGCAVVALAFTAGSPATAKSRILADTPAKVPAPKLKQRASLVLMRAGSGPCGSAETYAIVVNGHRIALVC